MDNLQLIKNLRSYLSIEEAKETVLSVLGGKETKNLNVDTQSKLNQLSTDELVQLFYALQIEHSESITHFNESIEDLSLSIFKNYSKYESLLDLGSGVGHMLYKASKIYGFTELEGEEINPKLSKISEIILNTLSANKKISNIDATLNFDNKRKYDAVFVDALFLNGNRRKLEEIAKQAGEDYISTRGNILEWVFVNRILNNVEDKGIGIIVIRDSALNSDFNEDIRKNLVENNNVKAVIQLPKYLLNRTAISTSILVLSKNVNDSVAFVDASKEFINKNRTQTEFDEKDINSIIEALKKDSEISRIVSKDVIQKKNYILSSKRYINNIEEHLINPVSLTSLVEVIRGRDVSKRKLDEDKLNKKTGYLINLSDIQNYYISLPQQEISDEILEGNEKYKVQPLDIIITARGSGFKIALVDKKLAEKNAIVSSNLNILRIKNESVNPYYLLAFLTSHLATEQFEQLSSGSVINVLTMKALENFKVSIVDEGTQNELAEKMEENLIDYYSYLEKVKNIQSDIKSLFVDRMEN